MNTKLHKQSLYVSKIGAIGDGSLLRLDDLRLWSGNIPLLLESEPRSHPTKERYSRLQITGEPKLS